MNKKTALGIILNCSKMYHENLENKEIQIIFQDKSKKIDSIKISFPNRNFLHLTGIAILNNRIKTANDFYNTCLNHQLSVSDFKFKSNGTTPSKLEILQLVMQIHKKAKIIGVYDNSKKQLLTEKLIGGINFCLGCIKDKNGYYVPNTALDEDIRNITYNQEQIVMILRKNIKDKKYNEITYINKKIPDEDKETLIKYCSNNNIFIDVFRCF